jgi:uncharacterized protein
MVLVGLDEFEAMRLCDLESFDQETAGSKMGVSRGTVQRLVDTGRKKLIGAMVSNAAIRIASCQNTKKQKGEKHNENLHPDYR